MNVGISMHVLLSTFACAAGRLGPASCRKEKLGNVQNENIRSTVSVSLFQAKVSAFRAERSYNHRQGSLPDILKTAAEMASTPLPMTASSPTTLIPSSTMPIIRHVRPARPARLNATETQPVHVPSEGHHNALSNALRSAGRQKKYL